jgi:hypothetical protein
MSAIDLREVRDKVTQALRETEADQGASPVLAAVVREFSDKAAKAIDLADGDREWEAVIELEQAGDSAKAAAEADAGAADTTTALVHDAHLAICMLKAGVTQTES